ncbi:hypothetical protein [Microbacterium sp. B24]|uniref:hypothetical protein n=1 Tax=Microbacterium sp. B24 TaxID=95616 RepID=UPI0003FE08A0|nr:hypothetical protein [Microbacterium sp. B24]
MASPSKAKGTRWESDLVKHFTAAGIPARRVAQSGALDVGDLHGIEPFVGQAKSYRDMVAAFRDGVAGANVQARRAGHPFGVAFVKRPGKGTADGYAVMDVETYTRVLQHIRDADARRPACRRVHVN